MGMFLIILVVGVFLFIGSLYTMNWIEQTRKSHEVLAGVALAGLVVGVCLPVIAAFFFFFVGTEKLSESLNTERLINERGKYVRLLNEDYNAANLSTALDFNETQKLCKFKESGFMWSHMGTNGVCADTIAIPTGKFMPSQKIKISSDTTGQ